SGVAADEDHGARLPAARLIADGVQSRRDVSERREKRAVRRAGADVTAERRDSGEDRRHRVFADAADGERARVASRRAEEAAAETIEVSEDAAELSAQRDVVARLQRELRRRGDGPRQRVDVVDRRRALA